jgi:hypothetical protein
LGNSCGNVVQMSSAFLEGPALLALLSIVDERALPPASPMPGVLRLEAIVLGIGRAVR